MIILDNLEHCSLALNVLCSDLGFAMLVTEHSFTFNLHVRRLKTKTIPADGPAFFTSQRMKEMPQ